MPNRSTDTLFQLVKSLEKGEKRNFKLYVQRNSGNEDLKVVQLFDALDKMDEYDEEGMLKKNKAITKQQLSNIKAHLYKLILSSLRLIEDRNNIDILLHEQLDFARILYNKGLYHQSLKVLDKLKETAKQHKQITIQLQAVFFEKKIEALHITRSMENRAEELSKESDTIDKKLTIINKLSSLALELYSWYIKHGHARDGKDVHALKSFFESNIPSVNVSELGFYEKLYLYQSYCWFGFIQQDLLAYYRYTQKWVDLFEEMPSMKMIETGQYIRGLHNLISAQFNLNNYEKFDEAVQLFESFAASSIGEMNMNVKIQVFVYLHIAKINKHFLEGTFSEGLKLVPYIEEMLKEYALHLDRHRVLVFYYKIACLYFGSGDNDKAIDYLNKIINWKVDLRTDLQCYARLLHLIAHFELGNYDLLEYLIKSVYRFMAKMNNLSTSEEEMFKFIRKSFSLSPQKLVPAFKSLKEKLEKLQGNPLESRSFMYLDIIAWLESKIRKVPVQDVRKEIFMNSRRRKKE
jgi:tetratricopeptide (TPR) repeat protein